MALGTLALLTELGEAGPVLCLVDDLQWLDAASRDALLFVARRLLAEPVVDRVRRPRRRDAAVPRPPT